MRKVYLFLLPMLLAAYAHAQGPKYRVTSVPVAKNGAAMRDPWVGGFDSPQFSECDVNQDGVKDLFVFDRVGNKVYIYLGNGGALDTMFTYAPQYEPLFPSALNNWALVRDYNNDGVPDIFTHTGLGTKVFKGSIINGLLHFDLVSPLLKYTNPPITTNLYTNISDIPAFVDVNGDGDLDVLTYDIFGATIGYFENQTVENAGNPAYAYDSLRYSLVTTCWGSAEQDQQSNSMNLNIDSLANGCIYGVGAIAPQGGSYQRHSGNSLYALKDPVYNAYDILNGNVGYNDLFFLRNNGGHGANGYFYEWDSIFPLCGQSILMASYPAGYGLHLNNAVNEDLLVAPNGYAPFFGATYPGRNVKNVQYYKSTGDTVCWFQYQNDSFLVHHMLDFGSNAKPVFYDFNGDGLLDIVVGNYGYFDSTASPQYRAAFAYYQNTGTATSPRFTEVTTDIGGLSAINDRGFSPTFGDLNGDGHPDMLVGDATGNLLYFQNSAATGSTYVSVTNVHYFNINVGQFAAPFLVDLNGDSLLDILVGKIDGTLNCYWNFGTRQNALFSADSVTVRIGKVNVSPYNGGTISGFSQPCVYNDKNGNRQLIVGNGIGYIYQYTINDAGLRDSSIAFQLVDSNFLGNSVGGNATVSVADINSDGDLEYLIGTEAGGVMMYSDSIWNPNILLSVTDVPVKENNVVVYPNPAKDYFICQVNNAFVDPQVELVDILGRPIKAAYDFNDGKLYIHSSSLTQGLYLVKIIDGSNYYSGKVLVTQ